MLLKENPFFKIKQLSECDRQFNGNRIMYLDITHPHPTEKALGRLSTNLYLLLANILFKY